ncbi:hypothetical protein [Ruegeria sp. EL01]|uniref:hypothetical protein n=1 Tax=Ruegeria sp. EL01 TaxID=2107578 RepID=UPI000EA81079|nr:hypothetical protein [Ruegeria sp. EL01]
MTTHDTKAPERTPKGIEYWKEYALNREAERDEWKKAFGHILSSVPLPDVLRASATVQDTIDYLRSALAERDALQARLDAARRVKPLVWRKTNERCVSADAPGFAGYTVFTRDDGLFSLRMSWSLMATDGVFDTQEEAKAAAQADYERRILSALADQPEGE